MLIGYDCPSRIYPSPAVPIVSDDKGEYKAVYLKDDLKLHLEEVDPNASFSKLSNCDNKEQLEKHFDYRKHRLFALSETKVKFYEVEDKNYFFIKLLIDKNFSNNNRFFRVSLAKNTGVADLLDLELQAYDQYIREDKPNRVQFWETTKKALLEELKQLRENTSSQLDKIPVQGEKASEVEVDYTNLRNLLQDKKFLEADKETAILMLQVLKKHENINIKNFPELDLRTIDKLWVIGSKGKFGFSVQKQKIDIVQLVFLLKSDAVNNLVDDWYFPFLGWAIGMIGRKTELDILMDILESEENFWGKGRYGEWIVKVKEVLKRNGLEEEREEGNGGRGGLMVMRKVEKDRFSDEEVEKYLEKVGRMIDNLKIGVIKKNW